MPTNMANMNPRMVSPPQMKITSMTTKVVIEVLSVRLSVWFRASLTMGTIEEFELGLPTEGA